MNIQQKAWNCRIGQSDKFHYCARRMVEDLEPILTRFLQSSDDKNTIVDTAAENPQYATSFLTQVKAVIQLITS